MLLKLVDRDHLEGKNSGLVAKKMHKMQKIHIKPE